MALSTEEQGKIKTEMDPVLEELKKQGINFNTKETEVVGLGDVVEATLTKFGITQERFKNWFGLQECNCTERKKFLNNLFSWKVNKR
jgi:flavodoxin